ncbi:hypothetical protein OROMI_008125 [Orobanche minor]
MCLVLGPCPYAYLFDLGLDRHNLSWNCISRVSYDEVLGY